VVIDGCVSAQQRVASGGLEGGREGVERRLVYHDHDIIGSGWCDGLPYVQLSKRKQQLHQMPMLGYIHTSISLTAALLGGK